MKRHFLLATFSTLYCTVTHPEIRSLKNLVADCDPHAFVIIGQGNEALGRGFRRLEPHQPVVEDIDPVAQGNQESG